VETEPNNTHRTKHSENLKTFVFFVESGKSKRFMAVMHTICGSRWM